MRQYPLVELILILPVSPLFASGLLNYPSLQSEFRFAWTILRQRALFVWLGIMLLTFCLVFPSSSVMDAEPLTDCAAGFSRPA